MKGYVFMKNRFFKACLCLFLSFSLLGSNLVTYAEETNEVLKIEDIEDDDDSEDKTEDRLEDSEPKTEEKNGIKTEEESEVENKEDTEEKSEVETKEDTKEESEIIKEETEEESKDETEEKSEDKTEEISKAKEESNGEGSKDDADNTDLIFAKENDIEFVFEPNDYSLPENASFAVEEKDSENYLGSDELKSAVSESIKNSNESIKLEAIKDVKIYDFTLTCEEQLISNFGEEIAVRISKDIFGDVSNLKAFYISDDGYEEVRCEAKDDWIYIYTTHFSSYAIVSYETATEENTVDETALIDSVKLLLNGDEISSDSTVSLNDELTIKYIFKSPLSLNYSEDAMNDENAVYLSSGNTYALPSIDPDIFSIQNELGFTAYLSDQTTKFGDVTIDTDGNVKLYVTYENLTEVYDVVFGVAFTLNAESVGSKEEFAITLPGGSDDQILTVKISENQPAEPKITKEKSELDEDSNILWTVTVTEAENPVNYVNGYTVIDTFDSNQSYVEGSFKCNGIEISKDDENLDIGDSNNTITYSFDSGSTTIITYKTHVDFLSSGSTQNNGAITLPIENTATLYDKANLESPITSATVEDSVSSAELKQFITKNGGELKYDSSNNTGVASWTITVNSNGYSYQNLTLYDVISSYDDYTMKLDESSVKVTENGTELVAGTDYEIGTTSGSSDIGQTAYTWKLVFLEDGNNQIKKDHTYTITYNTIIENYTEFLQTNHSTLPNNYAFLEYEYDYTGNGNYKPLKGPTLSKISVTGTSVATNAAIDIEFKDYYNATHELTWNVVVNKNRQSITNAVVEEILGDGQEFVRVSDAVISTEDTSENYTIDEDSEALGKNEAGNVVISFGDKLDGASASFTIVTKLTDEEASFWSNNATKKGYYKDTVKLTFADQATASSDTAYANCESVVLDKTAGSYNYDTHAIDYKITVNANKMAMDDIVVTDDLGNAGLSLVSGSVAVNGSAIDEEASNDAYYSYNSDGLLNIYLPDANDDEVGEASAQKIITFSAKVNDGDIFTSTNGGKVSVTNTASLSTSAINGFEVTKSVKTQWINKVIEKIASVDTTTKEITYNVYFNGNRQFLPSNLILRDTLGEDLSLDETSVKLYVGSINASTGEITAENKETDHTVLVTPNGEKTQLDVTLPQRENNTNIYVLTYKAMPTDIKSGGDYSNAILLVGYSSSSVNSSKADLSVSSFGGGWTKDPQVLYITVTDSDDGDIVLSGVKFEVTDKAGNSVATLTTKSNGKATLIGKLTDDTEYTISVIETSIPDLYEFGTTSQTFTTEESGGVQNAKTISFVAKKKTKEVKISKVDSYGNALSGVDLSISKTLTNNTTKTEQFTSSENAYIFNAAYDVHYTLSEAEEDVPFGYEKADDIVFYIDENGNLNLYDAQEGSFNTVDGDEIQMVDKNLDTYTFTVDVVNQENTSLTGAEISVYEVSESDPVRVYNTTGSKISISLPSGDYYIKQSEVPYGYVSESAIVKAIRIDSNGDFYIKTEADTEYVSTVSNFVFIDVNDEEITACVELFEEDELSTVLEGITLTLYELTDNENKAEIVESWITDGKSKTLYLGYQKIYILSETEGLDGYEKASSIKFTILRSDDNDVVEIISNDGSTSALEDNKVVLLTTIKLPSFGNGSKGPSKAPQHITKPETDENKETETTPTEDNSNKNEGVNEESGKNTVVDKDTDKNKDSSTNSDTATESDSQSGLETDSDSDSDVDADTSANTTDTYEQADNSAIINATVENVSLEYVSEDETLDANQQSIKGINRLAKTGGFLGTVLSYVLGIILIVTGAFIVFRKKKINE